MAEEKKLTEYTVSVTDKSDDHPCPGVTAFNTRGVGQFDKSDPEKRSIKKPLTDDVARELVRDGFKVEPEPPLPDHWIEGERIRIEREAKEAEEAAAKEAAAKAEADAKSQAATPTEPKKADAPAKLKVAEMPKENDTPPAAPAKAGKE